MLAHRTANAPETRRYELDLATRRLAHRDVHGIPFCGRSAELLSLRRTGARDLSLGRILEGHFNGAQLIAQYGTPAQRTTASQAIDDGRLFGVWNTQDATPVRIERNGLGYVLAGAKSWASGAGSIDIPIVTAAWADGRVQLCAVALPDWSSRIDRTAWQPLGMHASDSFTVNFDGVRLSDGELVGAPGDYERQPWFFGGALRYAAVQTGGVDRLLTETVRYLRTRGRDADPFQRARVGEMRIAAESARQWLAAGARAWQRFDSSPTQARAGALLTAVDMARTAIERAALETIERAVRCVGARGLVEPEPFAGIVRDLQMYLRQPAPDAAVQRIGAATLLPATDPPDDGPASSGACLVKAARKRSIATSTVTSG